MMLCLNNNTIIWYFNSYFKKKQYFYWLQSDSKSLNEITEEMETVIENHQKIVSISVRVENDSSKTFQTVYRKNNKLTVDRRSGGEVELQTQKSKTWTPLLMDCLTNNWLFGYYVFAENEKMRWGHKLER